MKKYEIYTTDDNILEGECDEPCIFEGMLYFGETVVNKNAFMYAHVVEDEFIKKDVM